LNIVLNIPQILLVWFQCSPPSALWDPLRQGQCDHAKSVYYTYFVGGVAAISDFYLAIIPITMLVPLRIDRKLKWGLSFLMGCGVFAGAAAIVRTWAAKFIMGDDSSCKQLYAFLFPGRIHSHTIDGVGVLFRWGEVEEWIVLITMSIPPVWPLFRPLTHRFIKSTGNRSQPQYKLYNEYGQFASTTRATQSAAPPIVTTTISISSHKGHQPSADTVDASSSDSLSRFGEDEPETPHTILSHNGDPEGWVELKHIKDHTRT
jgi:hypothetical protein